MANRNNIWANLDWLTILIYISLVLLGWVNIYAAVYNEDHSNILDMSQRYGKQLIWIIAAFIMAAALVIIDSRVYVSFAYLFYGLIIFLLIGVLLFGQEVKGSRSWFQIGTFAIQPAEFAKFTTALALAKFMSSYNFKMTQSKSIGAIAVIILLPVLLILLQNDTGSALVFVVFSLVLYREGMPGIFLFFGVLMSMVFILTLVLSPAETILMLAGTGLVIHYFIRQQPIEIAKAVGICLLVFGFFWLIDYIFQIESSLSHLLLCSSFPIALIFAIYTYRKGLNQSLMIVGIYIVLVIMTFSVDYFFHEVMEQHQRSRIEELLGIKSDPLGVGYNVNQSKIAIGSGGFTGKGFLNGTQTKFDFVPEQSTDFIFCTVGEEWGFLGSTVIILLFVALFIRLIYLSERQRSVFTRVYGYSVASILFFHFAVNIGMTIGLAPVIGIPLPFFSYGGSSLWSFTILLFIFLRLDSSRVEKLSL